RLVPIEAEAVAQTMGEELAISRVFDHLARGAVDIFAGSSGPEGLDAGDLGAVHDVADLSELVGRRAETDRAGDIGCVPVDSAAEVDQARIAFAEAPLSGRAVRKARGRSKLHEPPAANSQLDELFFENALHVALGHSRAHPLVGRPDGADRAAPG